MTTIRTPDDERPDWLYLPVTPGWYYEAATYPGHSDFAVDLNRRTKTGAWVNDEGDPVLAPQDGTVAEVDKAEGLVMLHHHGGRTQTEHRHMTHIPVRVGQKVKRGDRIGRIGSVAGSGRSTAPHLHHVQYRRDDTSQPFKRVPAMFEGKRLPVSVESAQKPSAWTPPRSVLLQGPPAPVTWPDAFREAQRALDKAQARVDGLTLVNGALTEERDAARHGLDLAKATADELSAALVAAKARITALENATPPDCTAAVDAERERVKAAVVAAVGAIA